MRKNSQSLMPVHSKELESSSTARPLVNKKKYTNQQIASQELVERSPRNSLVMEGFKCVICGAQTYMHMNMIPCMRRSNSKADFRERQPSSQLSICETGMASDMELVPCMAVEARRSNLSCVHCNIESDSEEQALQHGHIVKFKRKYNIKQSE